MTYNLPFHADSASDSQIRSEDGARISRLAVKEAESNAAIRLFIRPLVHATAFFVPLYLSSKRSFNDPTNSREIVTVNPLQWRGFMESVSRRAYTRLPTREGTEKRTSCPIVVRYSPHSPTGLRS